MGFETKDITSDASTVIANIAVDRVSSVDYPVSQLIVGADGSAKSLVTGSTGLPVDLVAGSGLTALQLIDDIVHVDDAAFSLGSSKGVMMMGFYGAQSVDSGDSAALVCDQDGALNISDGGNSITVDGTVTANLSATDNAVLDAMVVDLAALETLQTSTNTKLDTLETTLTAIETDQAAIEVLLGTIDADTGAIKTAVEISDNAISGSEMQVDVVASLPAGTNLVGGVFNSASTSAVGTTTFYDNDLDETKIEVTDNATVRIYSIHAINTTAAPLYLHLWDLDADRVTVGSTAPTNQYIIPGNADSDGAGFVMTFNPGKAYSTGFTVACTTNSHGNGAPGSAACHVNIEYISS